MIFDQAAAVVEKHLPVLIKRFKAARLFVFPGRAHEVLPKEILKDEREVLQENFFLPFPTIAVEDTATCTLMWDTEKDQQGLDGQRGFVEVQPFSVESILECADGEEPNAEKLRGYCAKYPPGTLAVSEGDFGPVTLVDDKKILLEGTVKWVAVVTKADGVLAVDTMRQADPKEFKLLCAPILRNVDVSLQEVFYFNTPNRFIVSETPLRVLRQRKTLPNRIRRTHQRPKYTLLRPKEIRSRLGLKPLTAGGPRRPHERRRHFRTFRDDRYVNMQGKTIIVPACWVGPSEATIGKRRYRVLLDK